MAANKVMVNLENIILPDKLPKTAIIGATGFIGASFFSAYRRKFPDCIGTSRTPGKEGMLYLDLLQPDIRRLRLADSGHKEALILAAIAQIDQCEQEKQLCREVNVKGTIEAIKQLAMEGIKPIYFSSDYVFDGESGNYSDNDCRLPTTEYGLQKMEVEDAMPDICGDNYLVIRSSKLFSLRDSAGPLIEEIAEKLSKGEEVRAAYDQCFCPTYIGDFVLAVAGLQAKGAKGIINVCSPQRWSRYELATWIARKMGVDQAKVKKISIDELDFKVKRLKNTTMVPEKFLLLNDFNFTPMSECIDYVVEKWKGKVK
ncbi:MAG: sugar nucleotide-binding protein [Candidatus Saganbacteria bacterium]|nr:sugar nucleotide-binding protein [Candidatus Saganbacteria bacterium]